MTLPVASGGTAEPRTTVGAPSTSRATAAGVAAGVATATPTATAGMGVVADIGKLASRDTHLT
eukprot:4406012-Prymnesium_polylepis.2